MRVFDLKDEELSDIVNIVSRCVMNRQNDLPIEILLQNREALKKAIYALEEHDFRFTVKNNNIIVEE